MNAPAAFDLTSLYTVSPHSAAFCFSILPENSAIIHTGIPHSNTVNFDSWEYQIKKLPKGYRFFINHSYDPVKVSDTVIATLLDIIKTHHPDSDPVFLSSKCSHYFNHVPGIAYFPYFFFYNFSNLVERPKSRRIGCLNRQNTPHRPWLMHNLLSRGLLDSNRDVYSISFTSPYDNTSYADIDSWLQQSTQVNHLLRQYPSQLSTHPDGFPNDVNTVDHPAWSTAIAVVTETEPGDCAMISEKTLKAIVSNSCWTAYMGESGYRLLEAFGFAPRFFEHHAQGINIDSVLNICKMLDSESVALDYRSQFLDQISYNFAWCGHNINSNAKHKILQAKIASPWFNQWYPNFQQSIN